MERFKQLLDELNHLVKQGAAPEILQQAVASLSFELAKDINPASRSMGTAKVAVVLPQATMPVGTEYSQPAPELPDSMPDAAAPIATTKPKERAKPKSTPLVLFDEELVIESVDGSGPARAAQTEAVGYDVMEEVPTLYMHRSVELNEQLKTGLPSLNEQLRVATAERLDVLREGPIHDLAKAIGVNERFQFIRELFRNDEVMYERSIKTINQFKVYPEAEFWINRELKTKLGWPIDLPLVHQFDQLVKRRFS